jgi:hypothetical protein
MDNREELKKSLAEEEERAKDNLANVEKIKKQLEELDKKEKQPTVSATGVILNSDIPQNRDRKFYVTAGRVFKNVSDMEDNGVYFTTEELAEQEALRIKGQEFIRRCAMLWNKDHDWRIDMSEGIEYMYYIGYGFITKLYVVRTVSFVTVGTICFDNQELAEKCIAELKSKYNEEQIKTIFGVI